MAINMRAPIASAGIVEIPMAQASVRPASSASPSPASRLLSRSAFLGRRFLQPDDADEDGIASRCENGVLTASVKKRRRPPPEKKKTKLRSPVDNSYIPGGFSSRPQVSTLSISLMPDASKISSASYPQNRSQKHRIHTSVVEVYVGDAVEARYQGSYRCRYPNGEGHGGGGSAILGFSELQQRRLVLLRGSPVRVLHLDFMVEQYHILNYEKNKVSI